MREAEIIDAATFAETFPRSGKLNWREVPVQIMFEWIQMQKRPAEILAYDVESVQMMFEEWWRNHRKR